MAVLCSCLHEFACSAAVLTAAKMHLQTRDKPHTLSCDTIGSMQNRLQGSGQERWMRYLNVYNLDRIGNFRDCAGTDPESTLRCVDGLEMKRGMLFRTGQLTAASENDIHRLKNEFKIKTYIDLRVGKFFNDNLEGADGPAYDVYPPSPCLLRHEHQLEGQFMPKDAGECRRVHINLHKGLQPVARTNQNSAEERFLAGCLGTLQDPEPRKRLLEVLEVLAEEKNYPIMFGCTAGKDRTGIIALLVQKMLGVADHDIIEQYMHTNLTNGHQSFTWILAKKVTLQRFRKTYGSDDEAKKALKALYLKEHPEIKDIPPDEFDNGKFDNGIEKFWSSLTMCDAPEAQILSYLDKATFVGAQDSMVYVSIARAVLAKIESSGGIDVFLDDLGFGVEKRAAVKRILIGREKVQVH